MCDGGRNRGSDVGFGFTALLLPPDDPPPPDNDKAPLAEGPSELNEEPPLLLIPGCPFSGFCFVWWW